MWPAVTLHNSLAAVNVIPDKPNYTTPKVIKPGSTAVLEATQFLSSLGGPKHAHQVSRVLCLHVCSLESSCMHTLMVICVQMPNEAYLLPITSSQEYGWKSKPLSQANGMFQYQKTKCDVTDYAAAYAASMGGESPYMHTNAAKAAVAK